MTELIEGVRRAHMKNEQEIVQSNLSREVKFDGHIFLLNIYRRAQDVEWTIEISHQDGNSLIWADTFSSEWGALNEGLRAIREDGIDMLANRLPET